MSRLRPPAAWEKIFWPVLVVVLLLAAWALAVKWSGTKVFPAPREVEAGLRELWIKGVLQRYIVDSLRRVMLGFAAAAAVGIPSGLLLGYYPEAAAVFNPLFQILRPISPIAWIPVAIVWFGVGEAAPIYLIFLGALFPIMVTATNGVRDIPPMYRQAASNFGLHPVRKMFQVIFPAALPSILTGLRIALGIAWLVVVAAEMVAVDSGLGYLVIDSRNSGKRYDLVVAAMLVIGVIGLILDLGFRQLPRMRAVRWGFRNDG